MRPSRISPPLPTHMMVHRAIVMQPDGTAIVPGLVALVMGGLTLTEGVDWERTDEGARLTNQPALQDVVWSAWVIE